MRWGIKDKMAKRRIVNPKGTFYIKCEVNGVEKICHHCGHKSIGQCGEKAITRIKDIVCGGKPLPICIKHRREFLKCRKGEEPHYKEVRGRLKLWIKGCEIAWKQIQYWSRWIS